MAADIDLCDFLRNADMHLKRKKETLQGRTSKEHAIKDDI